MTIEFVSNDFSKREVQSKLKTSLSETQILKGVVAFWKIDYGYFKDDLVNALKRHEDSFYCVDVSKPTNFDALLGIQKKIGSMLKFYVHTRRRGINEGLLHSKIIFMDKGEKGTETWVGSHNFTESALDGLNIEGSIIVTVPTEEYDDNSFYMNILEHLENVKNSCNDKRFDESSYDYYTALQTADQEKWLINYFSKLYPQHVPPQYIRTIEIEGDNVSNLTKSTVIIIGDKQTELSEIEKYGKKIIVHAQDYNGSVVFYKAELRARDRIDDASAKAVEFQGLRVGKKKANIRSVVLEASKKIKEQDLPIGGFYVHIEIKEKIFTHDNLDIYRSPNFKSLWGKQYNEKEVIGSPHNDKIVSSVPFID